MKKLSYADIATKLADKEKKFQTQLETGTHRQQNSARLMLEELRKRKAALVSENNARSMGKVGEVMKYADGGSINPRYKQYPKKYGSIGVDEIDQKYQEMVDLAEEYLQELYPGKTVKVQASDSLRGLGRQSDAKKKGYSTTSVSLHQFGGARDFNIYVDGQKILNENLPIYQKTLWRAAEELGMHHLDPQGFGAVDPYHIGLVKEGEEDTWENFFKENPKLLEMDSSKQVIDTLNELRDKDPKYARVADAAKKIIQQAAEKKVIPDATEISAASNRNSDASAGQPRSSFDTESFAEDFKQGAGDFLKQVWNLPSTLDRVHKAPGRVASWLAGGEDELNEAMRNLRYKISYADKWKQMKERDERLSKLPPEEEKAERVQARKDAMKNVGESMKTALRPKWFNPSWSTSNPAEPADLFPTGKEGLNKFPPAISEEDAPSNDLPEDPKTDPLLPWTGADTVFWSRAGREMDSENNTFKKSPHFQSIQVKQSDPFGKSPHAVNIPDQGGRRSYEGKTGNRFSYSDFMRYTAPFIDNLAASGGINRLEAPPAPVMDAAVNLDNEYNIDAALDANNQAVSGMVDAAKRNSGNAAGIMGARAAGVMAKIRGNNQLFGQKFNAERDSRNREALINSRINTQNTNRLNAYKAASNDFRNKRTMMRTQNFMNIGQDVQDIIASDRRWEMENRALDIMDNHYKRILGRRNLFEDA